MIGTGPYNVANGGLGYGFAGLNMDIALSGPIWDSYSTLLYPRTLREALYWSNWLKTRFGDYGAAIRRAVAYFMGGIDLTGDSLDVESRDHYHDVLVNQHNILADALEIGVDLQFNGNVFVSVFAPIKRVLVCPHCETVRYLENMQRGVDYDFSGGDFNSTCDSCHKSGKQIVKCYNDATSGKPLTQVNWNPLDISIDYCSITDAERITWTPNYNDKRFVENTAESAALQSLPATILDAIVKDEAVMFKGDSCLHMRKSTDAMNRSLVKGWGLPGWLPGFRYVVLLMLLERQLEAAAKDFILPLRLLYPLPQEKSGSDPIAGNQFSLKLGNLKNQVSAALQAQAVKQASWHMVSTPLGSLQLGGDAKAIIPTDVLEYISNALLNTQSVPLEFSKPSLQIGAGSPPVSFRMFEQTWGFDARQLDVYVNWRLHQCNQILQWPDMRGSIVKPSVADDPNMMNILAQAFQEGRLSATTFYRRFNIDPRMERKRVMEEQIQGYKDDMELQRIQKQLGWTSEVMQTTNNLVMDAGMQALQGPPPEQQGGMPPEQRGAPAEGGAPGTVPAPQGGSPEQTISELVSMQQRDVSLDQLQADAQQAAQIIISTPVGGPRNHLYAIMRQHNDTLHAMVKQLVEQMEQRAAQQGVEMQRAGELPV